MTTWNPRKPLNQPPHYGRLTDRTTTTKDAAQQAAKIAHNRAQFDRITHTIKYGLRATVV